MKRNWDTRLTDLDGNELQGEKGPITAGGIAITALLAPEQNQDGAEKFKRYQIAQKIHGGAELGVDELALLKQCVGKQCVPLAVGQIWELIDHDD